MVGGAVAYCAGLSFAGPKRATDRIFPVALTSFSSPASSIVVCSDGYFDVYPPVARSNGDKPAYRGELGELGAGIRGIDARLAVRPDSAASQARSKPGLPSTARRGSRGARPRTGRQCDQGRHTTRASPVARSGPRTRARYRRHELALPDGGRLRLGVDGTIERIDADGSTQRSWPVADPDWPTRRSGSGCARSHRHASGQRFRTRGCRERRRGPGGPAAPSETASPAARVRRAAGTTARFPRSYCNVRVSRPRLSPAVLVVAVPRAVPAPPRSEVVPRGLPVRPLVPPARQPSGWS
jgi:hypothetical protein